MGTVAAADVAVNNAEDVSGLILLAPLYTVPNRAIYAMRVLRYMVPWVYPLRQKLSNREAVERRILDFDLEINFEDEATQQWLTEGTKLPTSALDELRKMARKGRQTWPLIQIPTIILQGEQDEVLSSELAETIYQQIPTADKQIFTYPNSNHGLMRTPDPARSHVWESVARFIRKQEKQEA